MKFETELINIIQDDNYIMAVLKTVETLQLHDSWVAAGFIRNKVWDLLFDVQSAKTDIDVIYYDQYNLSEQLEKEIEAELVKIMPREPWSIKNQARMHLKNNTSPYQSSFDGVAHFPETPTAVAARVKNNKVEIIAPHGLEDLFTGIVQPTEFCQEGTALYPIYQKRVHEKNWQAIWPDLNIK